MFYSTGLPYKTLIVYGYARKLQRKNNLMYIIPQEIIHLILQYYDSKVFGVHCDKFKLEINRSVIKGTTAKCNEYIIYGSSESYGIKQKYDKGYKKGIHFWSIKCHNAPNCYHGIGIMNKKEFILCQNSHLYNYYAMKQKIKYIYIYPPSNTSVLPWNIGEIITVKLNCDEWNVSFYSESKLIYTQKIRKQTYYFFVRLCAKTTTNFECVSVPSNI